MMPVLQMLMVFLAEGFSVCCRREPFLFLEKPAEVERVLIPDHGSDVGNIVVSSFQKYLCVAYPCGKDILHGS